MLDWIFILCGAYHLRDDIQTSFYFNFSLLQNFFRLNNFSKIQAQLNPKITQVLAHFNYIALALR